MNHSATVAALLSLSQYLKGYRIDNGPMGESAPFSSAAEQLAAIALALPIEPTVRLSTLARIIAETAPADHLKLTGANAGQGWTGGVDAARERVANTVADSCDLRPSERAGFVRACGLSV